VAGALDLELKVEAKERATGRIITVAGRANFSFSLRPGGAQWSGPANPGQAVFNEIIV